MCVEFVFLFQFLNTHDPRPCQWICVRLLFRRTARPSWPMRVREKTPNKYSKYVHVARETEYRFAYMYKLVCIHHKSTIWHAARAPIYSLMCECVSMYERVRQAHIAVCLLILYNNTIVFRFNSDLISCYQVSWRCDVFISCSTEWEIGEKSRSYHDIAHVCVWVSAAKWYTFFSFNFCCCCRNMHGTNGQRFTTDCAKVVSVVSKCANACSHSQLMRRLDLNLLCRATVTAAATAAAAPDNLQTVITWQNMHNAHEYRFSKIWIQDHLPRHL